MKHNERPTKCVAKVCKCPKGRNYQVDTENHEHSLVFCEYCGSLAVHLDCLDDDEFRCDDCDDVIIRTQAQAAISNSANVIAGSSSSNVTVADSVANEREKYRMIASKFNIPDCYVRLIRLKADDFDSTPKLNYQKCLDLGLDTVKNSTSNATSIANSASSSDENEIQPILRKPGKINAYFSLVSDSDSEIEIAPVKVSQTVKANPFSDSDSDNNNKTVNNANGVKSINAQQTEPKSTTSNTFERKVSISEDEPHRASVIIRNFYPTKNSDDPLAGKENEKPVKTVAIVRPFTLPETSFCQNSNIKTEKYPYEAFYPSSSGTSDESSYKSSIHQRYDYLKNVPKIEKQPVATASYTTSTKTTTTTSTKTTTTIFHASPTDATTRTPNKRKYRSVRSYFCDSSSSENEVAEPKPKRKSPKQSKKISSAHVDVPPNQSTIVNFFQRKLNQGI